MVRNFWVEADIDGRQTMLSGGPRRKDGGMQIELYQRSEGGITRAISIYCFVGSDGLLHTDVTNQVTNETVTEITTER